MNDNKRNRSPKLSLEECFNLISDYNVFKESAENIMNKYGISKRTFYDVTNKKGAYEYLNEFNKVLESINYDLSNYINGNYTLIKNYKNELNKVFVGYKQFIKYTPEYFNALEEKHNLYNSIEKLKHKAFNKNSINELSNLKSEYSKLYRDDELLNNPIHPITGSSCSIKELLRTDAKLKTKVILHNDKQLYDLDRLKKLTINNKNNTECSIEEKLDILLSEIAELKNKTINQ